MKKRILSMLLTAVLTFGCFAGIPAAQAAEADAPFVPEEHLIKISDTNYQIVSLDGKVTMNLNAKADAQWTYSVDKISTGETEATEWIQESNLGLVINNVNYFKSATVEDITVSETDRTYDHFGNQSVLHDNGVAAEVEIKQGNTTYFLEIRVYNDGVAFRYRMPGTGNRTVSSELTTFNLCADATAAWYGINNQDYESAIYQFSTTAPTASRAANPSEDTVNTPSTADRINAPLTAVLTGGKGYIAIQEAGVGDVYGGTNLYCIGAGAYQVGTSWNTAHHANRVINGEFATGWRLINLAEDLNELVNNYNVYHVCDEPDAELYADTSWIEPGRSAWSWLTDYGATLKTEDAMYEFTLAASRLGFEYNVIDEGYRQYERYDEEGNLTVEGWGKDEAESNAILADLGAYGNDVGVKQLLWAYVNPTHNGCRMTNEQEVIAYMDFLAASDLHGGKIDFWWSEEDPRTNALQHTIMKEAAKRELVVNIHGCNKPGGIAATYPNALTREGIRGAEQLGVSANNTTTTQSRWLTRQLYTRYLSGHADFTPTADYAMNFASLILIDSPLNVIATHPERILQNPAVDFIKSIPTVWDQTVVLSDSVLGKSAIYAKETDGNWYLGGIFSGGATNVTADLGEFLGEGEYMMELWVDTQQNGTTVPVKTERTVTAADVLEIGNLANGYGFAARFSKIKLSQFGGEISEPITVTTVDADATVKYTTDGSDPVTSKTAQTYNGSIVLTESCDLRVAVVDGDDAGASVDANFNLIEAPFIEETMTLEDEKTTVSLQYSANATVKYTTDGSDPATSKTAKTYEGPFEVTEICTLKAVVLTEDYEPRYYTYSVFVNMADDKMIQPDLYLGTDFVSARTDWGNNCIDQSMANKGSQISLGGTTSANGTKYAHGISANSVATWVYNVPSGAEKFVGVVGIDDMCWDDVNGANASATCTVTFDGVDAVTTPVFTRGEYYNLVVDVPDGAEQITITFGNGGNGNTCDNVSMGNAGWVMDPDAEKSVLARKDVGQGVTVVTLTKNFVGNLYYTSDGSEPTTASAMYINPLSFRKATTVKVLGVPADGSENITLTVEVEVEKVEILIYEAEDANRTGGSLQTPGAGSTASGRLVGDLAAGVTINFDVNVGVAGERTLDVYYISWADRNIQVSVNGGAGTTILCPSNNSDWDVTVLKVTTKVNLNAGANTISISNPTDWAPNIDRIELEVLEGDNVDPEPTPAEEFVAMVSALGEITLEKKDEVAAARAAYEALDATSKTQVANALAVLEAAEAKIAELEKPAFEKGDVDRNGKVDVADIMKLKALIMADKWSDEELAIGDMDASAKLDVGDIMAVKNVIMSK